MKIVVALLFAPLLMCCRKGIIGSGNIISVQRKVGSFTSVRNSGDFNIIIKNSPSDTLTINADDNIIEEINTSVVNGQLLVKYNNPITFLRHSPINIVVNTSQLTEVILSGSGNIQIPSGFNNSVFTLKMDGSGNINSFLNTEFLNVNVNGSGDIDLSGSAKSETLIVNGSGRIRGFHRSENVSATIQGSGKIEVTAITTLHVNISGSGSVYYKGSPSIQKVIGGSGKLVNSN